MLYSLRKTHLFLNNITMLPFRNLKRFNIVENEIEWNNGENGQDKQGRKKASSD